MTTDAITMSKADLDTLINTAVSKAIETNVDGLRANRDAILSEHKQGSVALAEANARVRELEAQLQTATTTLNSGSVDKALRDAIAASDIDAKFADTALNVMRTRFSVEPKTGKTHGYDEAGQVATFDDTFKALLSDPAIAPMRTNVEVTTSKDPFGQIRNEVHENNPFAIGGDAAKARAAFKQDPQAAKTLMGKAGDKLSPIWRVWFTKNR
ncbi:hypothetical protein T8K17_13345 [Thalassobaculum sp. OXR-137]|uniref:hypothetical protein n=1 Tax=Thalassobaculum sp. OXR-137 TaxID=3100173 RepID=UPI002AC8C3C2|nr:hypothetical protein [Thalassobaculum sp. OXR-137]WPZ32227.1 hypothetical protein T8K17_13345 [Thalassobaculum sp. OXR-137]